MNVFRTKRINSSAQQELYDSDSIDVTVVKNTMYSKKRKRTIKLNEIRIKLISNPNAIFARIIVSKRASTFNEGDYNFLSGIYLNVISLSYNMQFIRSIRILYL